MTRDKLNFIVVGGESNPIYATSGFIYSKTWPVDKWIPKTGIRHDAEPVRMPEAVTFADGSCGIG